MKPDQNMAASDLDHLKSKYRRRFCRSSRVLGIDTKKGQNILDILQDYFEEDSISTVLSTNSTESVLHSTSKVENNGISLPCKESQCQKSPRKSVPVSSKKKEATLQLAEELGDVELTEELGDADNRSVQTQDACEENLATNVVSTNKLDLRRMSSGNHGENMEFYLSIGSPSVFLDAKTLNVSVGQKKEAYTCGNSVNKLSSSMEISLKTRKRLNFEDKDVSQKIQMENIVSEESRQRTPSGTSQKTVQEFESQPRTPKSFSALFLEAIRKKDESSSIVKHTVTAPPHSSPVNDTKLLEDEFVIEESEKSFANHSWITIPRKTGLPKRSIAENTAACLQQMRSRGKCPSKSATLTHNTPAEVLPGEKSQSSEQKKLAGNHVLTDEMTTTHRNSKSEMYSENAKKSKSKRTVKENQKNNFKANIVEEQVDIERTKDKTINRSNITQDKLQKNSDLNVEKSKEMNSDHILPKQVQPVGSKKSKTSVPYSENRMNDIENSSNRSKMNKLISEKDSLTVMRSRRVSRRPSDWWVVKSEESLDFVNELPMHHSSRQKPANKANNASRKKPIPHRRCKKATQHSTRAQKVLNAEDSGESTHHDEISNFQKSLESKKADLAEDENFHYSGTGSPGNQRVHLQPQTSECLTPPESNSDCEDPQASVFEESGPSRVKNHLMSANNNSGVDDKGAFENSDDSRVKEFKELPERKVHYKLVLPTNTPNVRRTKRTRLKPMEYWRGERADYQLTSSGGFVIGGILSPDTVSSKRKAKENTGKVSRKDNRKKICLDNDERMKELINNLTIQLGDPLQPTMVKDQETKEMMQLALIRQRDTYQFLVQHGELRVYKTLDTPFFSTGKLVLGPHQEKGKQHVGSDILVFYVDFGDLLCTLHETSYIITTGDSFYVPSGNYYNIKNLLSKESTLLFTQIKR